MNHHCIITTINKPTKSVEKLHEYFGENLIVVGDEKTPNDWVYKNSKFISIKSKVEFGLSSHLKHNHYSIKNIGYLTAIMNNADLIYDTDDDNTPNENWRIRKEQVEAHESVGEGWYNAYNIFSNEYLWARGFSLKELKMKSKVGYRKFRTSSIQQGLADGDPDVDAILRLVFGKPTKFTENKNLYINKNTWCPFNSQSTWFFPKAYPLLYLPIHATFRMTDIWRSFVAQRCLWEIGEGVTFHSPSEVFQDRNEHDLMKDFQDEIPGYLHNDKIVEILSSLKLKEGQQYMCDNLFTCYAALINNNILPKEEILSVRAWIKDYENVATDMG